MYSRTISRLATTGLVAGTLSVALAVPALAVPADGGCACGGARVEAAPRANASGNVTSGTDVAAPDQQAPTPTAAAKPVPQPPTWPVNAQSLPQPRTVVVSDGSSFQWDDAGIGAGGALAVVLVGLGGVAVIRRRHGSGPLPA